MAGLLRSFPFGEETFLWDQILWTGLQSVTTFKQSNDDVLESIYITFRMYLWFSGDDLKYQKTCVPRHWEGDMSRLEESQKELVVLDADVFLDFKPVQELI